MSVNPFFVGWPVTYNRVIELPELLALDYLIASLIYGMTKSLFKPLEMFLMSIRASGPSLCYFSTDIRFQVTSTCWIHE